MTETFFTADTHFGHANIVQHELHLLPPGVDTIKARDEFIIEQWNVAVGPNDTVYHLGDFCFRNESPIEWYCGKLNGRIHLVYGNHDIEARKRPHNFASAQEYLYLRHYNERIALFHYPMQEWRSSHIGTWHLHGHVHGSLANFGRRVDVGIMLWNYRPVNFMDLRDLLKNQPPTPHHGAVGKMRGPAAVEL